MRNKVIKLVVIVILLSVNLYFLWPAPMPEAYSGPYVKIGYTTPWDKYGYQSTQQFYASDDEHYYEAMQRQREDLPPYVMHQEYFSFLGRFLSYNTASPFDHKEIDLYFYQAMEFRTRGNAIYLEIRSNIDFDCVNPTYLPDYYANPMPETDSFWSQPDLSVHEPIPQLSGPYVPQGVTFQHGDILYNYYKHYLQWIAWQYNDCIIALRIPLPSDAYPNYEKEIVFDGFDVEEVVRSFVINHNYDTIPESGNEFIEKILDPDHAEEAVQMVNDAIDRSVRKNTLIRWTPVIRYVTIVLLAAGSVWVVRILLRRGRKKNMPPEKPEAAPGNIEKPGIKADPIPKAAEAPPGLLESIFKKE